MAEEAPPIPAADKLACAKRELAMRERVYPRWIDSGRISRIKAAQEIAAMRAIVADYEAAAQRELLI